MLALSRSTECFYPASQGLITCVNRARRISPPVICVTLAGSTQARCCFHPLLWGFTESLVTSKDFGSPMGEKQLENSVLQTVCNQGLSGVSGELGEERNALCVLT